MFLKVLSSNTLHVAQRVGQPFLLEIALQLQNRLLRNLVVLSNQRGVAGEPIVVVDDLRQLAVDGSRRIASVRRSSNCLCYVIEPLLDVEVVLDLKAIVRRGW